MSFLTVESRDHLRSDVIRILRINCGSVQIYDVLRSSFIHELNWSSLKSEGHCFTSLQASAKFRFPLHGIKLEPALVSPRKYSFTCAKQSGPLKKYFDTSCVRLSPLILEEKKF